MDREQALREISGEFAGVVEEGLGFAVDRGEDLTLFVGQALARAGVIPAGAWRLAPAARCVVAMAHSAPTRGGHIAGALSYLVLRAGVGAAAAARRTFRSWR